LADPAIGKTDKLLHRPLDWLEGPVWNRTEGFLLFTLFSHDHRKPGCKNSFFLPGARIGTVSWGMGMYFNEYDAKEFAPDALVAWKAKVLKRVGQAQRGETNSKGQPLPDAFVGQKLGGQERNLIADVGRFVFNVVQSRGKTAANRARLAPMDPLASEHEGERGEDEPPIGHQASTGETPETAITGAEQTRGYRGHV
jgi:hypothetical protein